MKVMRQDQVGIRRGDEERFTGAVWLEVVTEIPPPAGLKIYRVFFDPKARTAWHAHPDGQVLHIVTGMARIQRWNGSVVEVGPGHTVYFDPGEKHWHGAAPNGFMVHYAISPVTTEEDTNWMAKVTDDEYGLQSD